MDTGSLAEMSSNVDACEQAPADRITSATKKARRRARGQRLEAREQVREQRVKSVNASADTKKRAARTKQRAQQEFADQRHRRARPRAPGAAPVVLYHHGVFFRHRRVVDSCGNKPLGIKTNARAHSCCSRTAARGRGGSGQAHGGALRTCGAVRYCWSRTRRASTTLVMIVFWKRKKAGTKEAIELLNLQSIVFCD